MHRRPGATRISSSRFRSKSSRARTSAPGASSRAISSPQKAGCGLLTWSATRNTLPRKFPHYSHERVTPLNPGSIYKFEIPLQPIAYLFHRGPGQEVRTDHRQPAVRRPGACGRILCHRQRRQEQRPLLGHSRRRRQLWRGDVVRVSGASGAYRLCRPDAVGTGSGSRHDEVVLRIHPAGAGRCLRLFRVPGGPSRSALP